MYAESILIEFTACFTDQNSITDISILILKSLLWTKLRDIVVFWWVVAIYFSGKQFQTHVDITKKRRAFPKSLLLDYININT